MHMIKNSTPKKTTRLIILLLCLTTAFSVVNAQSTITSSATGGNWNDIAAWTGGVIPTANDNVIINSAIYVNGDVSCVNLTVNSGAALYNTYGWSITVTATGTVINNGSILTNPSGYSLYLSLKGNIENNGVWNVTSTSLSGSSNQIIKETKGKMFEGPISMTDSIGDIILGSDVLVSGSSWNLNRSTLRTNGFSLLSDSYNLNNGYIVSNDVLELEETIIAKLTFSGNYTIDGKVYSQSDNIFNGSFTLKDTLTNQYGWSNTISINGLFINNGVFINNPSGYSFNANIDGDIENNGVWRLSSTSLSGTANQHIKQSLGKAFEGPFLMVDSIGDLILSSDVLFSSNTFDLNKTTLRTNGYKLQTKDYTLRNGYIRSKETILLENTVIESLRFFGNYILDGNIYSQMANECNDTVTIADTLFNRYGWTNTLIIKGNIINKGTIKNNPQGYSFNLDIHGNVRNEGIWNVSSTNFVGTADQTIEQSVDKRFEGTINNTDSIGDIVLKSDVMLESNTWNLAKTNIRTNGFRLLSNANILQNGRITSNDTLRLYNAVINNMQLFGDYKLSGKIFSQDNNVFNGNCTLVDTLYNRYGWTNTIAIKGNILNKGILKTNPDGYSLHLNCNGNIRNEGIWAVSSTNLIDSANQTISQAKGKSFQGPINNTDSIGDVILGSDVMLESNIWNLNKATIRTNGHKLLSNAYTLKNGLIISNDTLLLDNSVISSLKFFGNYALGGNIYSQDNNVFNDNCTIIDTLFNQYGWTNTIAIKGNIINKGTIKNNPQGYSFYLAIDGNVRNEGIWSPTMTNFTGTTNQNIEQSIGKRFLGNFNTSDSIGDILLGSDINLDTNTWNMNKCIVRTNGHKLLSDGYIFNNGTFVSNDTLRLNNSVINAITFNGNYKLDGNIHSQDNNIFNDTLTVLDTLMNRYGWSNTIQVKGNLVNKGTILNNPSGYSFSMQVKGNITNYHLISMSNVYLIGTNSRIIAGSNANGISANILVDDSVKLIGNSVLPSIGFTTNPKAWCTIDTSASLQLQSVSNPARILNHGRLSISQSFDNTIANTLTFFDASANFKAGVEMNKLTIDHYGYQQHPTATGTVNCWWRLRNYPQNFSDSLNWLKLSYKTDALNKNLEDSIKVYYSANAGINWKRIKTGVSIDTNLHMVIISNAPSSGHYILSNSSIGISTFHPLIESAEPRFGGNSGQVTFYIYGAGFKSTSKAILRLAGHPDIVADTTFITDAIGESMLARFNLKNKYLGKYDVIVQTPGDSTLTLPAYFTVLQGERSAPWVALTARDRFLVNRWQTFNLNYGNTANVDARGTMLVFVINDLPTLEVEFPDFKVTLPKAISDMGKDYTRIADSLPLYYTTDTLSGYVGIKMRVYAFYIPVISAGSSKNARVKVKLNDFGTLTMDSWVIDPFFENLLALKSSEPMPAEVRACITSAAMSYFATGVIGLIPGMGCYGMVDKVVGKIEDVATGETNDGAVQSWFWSGVSWASSITQCATSLMPGLGQATQLGIGIASMIVDSKDNYDQNQECWNKFKKKSDSKKNSRGVSSFDPNEMVGPEGFTSDHYISKDGNINYRIYFENKKTAAASALEVFVKDTLDASKFDLKTFSFNSISFGDTTVRVQDFAKEFTLLVDMFPKKDIIVQAHGKLDTTTGVISWEIRSLDRITKELTEDPDLGFLPPNVNSPEGEGNLAFSCKLKKDVAHDDVISNKATIVFDFNAAITTNTFTNRIDTLAPTSSINQLSATQSKTTFEIDWTGNDEGSGIRNYNIFVAEGTNPYVLWKISSNANKAPFIGENGKTYSFYSIVTDSLGLAEATKVNADATTKIETSSNIESNIKSMIVSPNITNAFSTVSFEVNEPERISVVIENSNGVTVQTVLIQKMVSGSNSVRINVSAFPSGAYYVRLKGEKTSVVRNLFVVK